MRTIITKEKSIDGTINRTLDTTSTEGNSSIEITVDAKGFIKPTVKVYNDDIDLAKKDAIRIWNDLKLSFGENMLGHSSIKTE